jgi:hypothetical protein
MELTTKMLADAAHLVEGKLYVLGGQWDRLTASRFPVRHPSMTVVLVLKVEYNEAPKNCTLHVELMIDGEPHGVNAAGQLSIGHAPGLKHGAPQYAPLAVPFSNVQFEKPGRYEWIVSVDDEVLGQIPLEVVQTMSIPVPHAKSPEA